MMTPKGTIKKAITPRKLGAMNSPDLNFSFRNRLLFRFGTFTFFTGSSAFTFAFVKVTFFSKIICSPAHRDLLGFE